MIRLDITSEHTGQKMTECVAELLPELAKYNLKRMLRAGDIKLNGSLVKKDYELEDGDIVEVYMPLEFERAPLLDICYEDNNLIVLNKQPGVAATGGETQPDLMSMVINHMKDTGSYYEELGYIPFLCTKLDIYTGGLVLFAKNGDMFEYVREAVKQRRIKRVFQAIVRGCPPEGAGEFQHFYVKDDKNRYRVAKTKVKGAVPIYTKYRVLQTNGEYSLLEVEPVTQYMNQERAHLEAAGYPILGDNMYGVPRLNKKLGIRYQALWGTEIIFTTGTGNPLEYINGIKVFTDDIGFPLVDLD